MPSLSMRRLAYRRLVDCRVNSSDYLRNPYTQRAGSLLYTYLRLRCAVSLALISRWLFIPGSTAGISSGVQSRNSQQGPYVIYLDCVAGAAVGDDFLSGGGQLRVFQHRTRARLLQNDGHGLHREHNIELKQLRNLIAAGADDLRMSSRDHLRNPQQRPTRLCMCSSPAGVLQHVDHFAVLVAQLFRVHDLVPARRGGRKSSARAAVSVGSSVGSSAGGRASGGGGREGG